jgi:glutaconyl-CoA/methylmalonyl-CoA decarboxylase subunit gamma
MKRYAITVNGQCYDVAVEEIGEARAPVAAGLPSAPRAAEPPAAAAPESPAAPQTSSRAVPGATSVKAPMPGTVSSFSVEAGQAVKRGDVILILEAMKMENEIVAPVNGTIAALRVAQGASVNTGDPLVDIT